MSIPEMSEIKRKNIAHDVKLKIATRNRALKDCCKKIKLESSVEAFNDSDLRKEPDRIGLTVYYPDKVTPTHFRTEFFPIGIDDKEFTKQLKRMEKELLEKVPK